MIADPPGEPAWAVVIVTQDVRNGSVATDFTVYAMATDQRQAADLLYEIGPYLRRDDLLEAYVCETTWIDPPPPNYAEKRPPPIPRW